ALSIYRSGTSLLSPINWGLIYLRFPYRSKYLAFLDSRIRGNHSWRWRATPNDENLFSEQ
ncbi:MAG: hypothetical protein AAFY26_21280, partial [Cyanobacteria bacterium J06638_22]